MGVISGKTMFLALFIAMNLNFHVEAGFRSKLKAKKPERDYTIEIEEVKMLSTPGVFLDPSSRIYSTLYNDTTRVAAGDIWLVEDMPEDLRISTSFYKFDSSYNRWLPFMQSEDPLCKYMKQKTYIFNVMETNGNLTRECPKGKGFYYFRNFIVGTDEFPLHVEESKWRISFNIFTTFPKNTVINFEAIVWTRPTEDDE